MAKRKRTEITSDVLQSYFHLRQTEAAKQLGVSPSTIRRRLTELSLHWPRTDKQREQCITDKHFKEEEHSDRNSVKELVLSFSPESKCEVQAKLSPPSQLREKVIEKANSNRKNTSNRETTSIQISKSEHDPYDKSFSSQMHSFHHVNESKANGKKIEEISSLPRNLGDVSSSEPIVQPNSGGITTNPMGSVLHHQFSEKVQKNILPQSINIPQQPHSKQGRFLPLNSTMLQHGNNYKSSGSENMPDFFGGMVANLGNANLINEASNLSSRQLQEDLESGLARDVINNTETSNHGNANSDNFRTVKNTDTLGGSGHFDLNHVSNHEMLKHLENLGISVGAYKILPFGSMTPIPQDSLEKLQYLTHYQQMMQNLNSIEASSQNRTFPKIELGQGEIFCPCPGEQNHEFICMKFTTLTFLINALDSYKERELLLMQENKTLRNQIGSLEAYLQQIGIVSPNHVGTR